MGIKQNSYFFENQKSKWPTKTKLGFSKTPILNFFSAKISGIGLWVSRINDVAQPCQAVRRKV
jgi:hypothetical protein